MVEFIDPPERFETMLEEATLEVRQEFLLLVERMEESFDLAALAALLGSGRFAQAFDDLGRVSAGIGNVYPRHYAAAGIATANWLTETVDNVILGFDSTNPRAAANVRNNQSRLVQHFINAQRRASEAAILGVVEEDGGGEAMALAFLASIGLTPQQYQAVRAYRKLLTNLSRDALDRALRDTDTDSELRSAISSSTPLTSAQIERMVAAYRRNMLAYRADVIATTEGGAAISAGRLEAYLQAIEQGQLPEEALTRIWNTSSDERVRGSHRAMHGQRRSFGVSFLSGLGNMLMYPRDPSAPVEDRIECRCSEGMVIVLVDSTSPA